MAALMQAMEDKAVSAKFECVDSEVRVCQSLDDIESLSRLILKVTEVLLDTDKFLKTIAHIVKTEADKVMVAR